MAHVSLVTRPKGLVQRYAWRYTRKMFGHVVEPVQASAHHNGVLTASGALTVAYDVLDGRIVGVRVVSNPDKLTALRLPASGPTSGRAPDAQGGFGQLA